MKAGASGINSDIQQGQLTTARLLKVTREYDGAVYGFTDHDQNLVYGGVTYLSTTSFNPFNLVDKNTAEASDSELAGAFDSVITRVDVLADLWDNAQFQILLVNWQNLARGAIIAVTGSFGEFEPEEFGFKVKVHGLEYPLTFLGAEICGPGCRVDFGSALCAPSGSLADGTTINSLLQTGTVVSTDGVSSMVVSGLTDTGKPFDGGLATFLSGSNANLSVEILHVDFGTPSSPAGLATITLRPWIQIAAIQPGDTFDLFPACDKTFQTCAMVWLNGINFQGEPHTPSPDAVLQYPDYVPPHT